MVYIGSQFILFLSFYGILLVREIKVWIIDWVLNIDIIDM